MKKVLITVTTLKGGGAERVVSVWASQLAEMGYDISLLLYGREENEYPISEKVKIYTVADSYAKYKELGYFARLSKMRKLVKEIKPDVVINFLPRMQIWMMIATFGLKMKRIETVRVSPWEVCKGSKYERMLWKLCFKRSHAIIIQTEEQGEYFSPAEQKKCVVIPNPISKFCIDGPKVEYSEKTTKFIAAGRLTSQKGFPMLIAAFAKAHENNPDIRLSIYGTGDEAYIAKLNSIIEENNMQGIVELMGRTTDMHGALLSADAFLMSSNYEGMPNALVEAMACGLVCLSTDCRTGPRDLIDHGINGYLTKTGDTDSFASIIATISSLTKEEAQALGHAAREKVLMLCDESNSIRRLVEVIEK